MRQSSKKAAYPVHDSLIIPALKAAETREILANWFFAKAGLKARIT